MGVPDAQGVVVLFQKMLVRMDIFEVFFSLVFDVSESDDDAAISIFGPWCSSEK